MTKRWQNAGLVALAVVTVGAVVGAVHASGNAPSAADRSVGEQQSGALLAAQDAPNNWPVADFLGDSYTSGSLMGGTGPTGWPVLLARTVQWRYALHAVGGTGFVSKGSGAAVQGNVVGGTAAQTFIQRVPAIIADKPSFVVVEGGHNDAAPGQAATIGAAAKLVLDQLRAGLPQAKLIVLGVIWPDTPPPYVQQTDDAIRAAAEGVPGTVFIDPIAEHWFDGPNHQYIGTDGTHPTDAGHQHVAGELEADLHRLGIAG